MNLDKSASRQALDRYLAMLDAMPGARTQEQQYRLDRAFYEISMARAMEDLKALRRMQ
jgi:hypothetical protein